MKFDDSILRNDEKAIFSLRKLFAEHDYKQFKMSKFEEYDLYSENKDFLVSDGVITFNDTNGKLLALKPDVTLSIIKNCRDEANTVEKFYYNENVYRVSESSHAYKEIMQSGVECIGNITSEQIFEVLELSLKSLSVFSNDYILHLCDIELVNAVFEEYNIEKANRATILKALTEKNAGVLKSLCSPEQFNALKVFVKSYKTVDETINKIKSIAYSNSSKKALTELEGLCTRLCDAGYKDNIHIDFSIISQTGYYSKFQFKGYINGVSTRVLSGGQYDGLMQRMGKKSGAIGFAVYLDAIERLSDTEVSADEKQYINIALPKGRLGEKVYAMFEAAGFECPSIKETNRKLIFENTEKRLRFFWVKPSDVAIYVERGAADIGVAGKDILLEYTPDVYELLDLKIGKCRMAVAAKKDFCDDTSKTLRVATKFSNIARSYYAKKCRDIDIIHLNGSIEIAPILNLSDVIVDIVETGKTLLENDLAPFETIVPISARLISNKSSFSFKNESIEQIKKGLLEQVEKNND